MNQKLFFLASLLVLALAGCGSSPVVRGDAEGGRLQADLPAPVAGEIGMRALSLVGRPYRWGGASYEGGFDCSGFVQAVYRDGMGVRLPRNAAQQAFATVPIERRNLASGDLVFFNTLGHSYSHVGIYVGDGRFVHSPKAGGSIRMESMSKMYWETKFDGARRVVL